MEQDKFKEIIIPLKCGNISGCWYGTQQERPILALHGWGDNAGSFALLAPLLADHIPILAIDYSGHGRSSYLPHGIKYHYLDFIRIVREIMFYYKWPKISLMGHSISGGVAFLFAGLFPGKVDIIISLDGFDVRDFNLGQQLKSIYQSNEGYLQENEKIMEMEKNGMEPILYEYEQLQGMVYKATEKSVNLENTKYLLERKIKASPNNSNKFYLTDDRRAKFMQLFFMTEMEDFLASRIEGVKWLILKSESSSAITIKKFLHLAEILQHKNKLLEFYNLPNTTHHLHLNNANQVAVYIREFLKNNRKSETVKIDGSAAQFKNKKNFSNLCHHSEDFNCSAEWHFFATSHGKGPSDGLGGTVKREARKASLQRPFEDQITTPLHLYNWCQQTLKNCNFAYLTEKDYEEEEEFLTGRFVGLRTIPGTQKLHSFIPISKTQLQAKMYSADSEFVIQKIYNKTKK